MVQKKTTTGSSNAQTKRNPNPVLGSDKIEASHDEADLSDRVLFEDVTSGAFDQGGGDDE